jgi:polysaccharide biosynthesis protein PslG
MRCSLGWDDYEPERGRFDFAWLDSFADLARRDLIGLRPYIGYTPRWVGLPGHDDQDWNKL